MAKKKIEDVCIYEDSVGHDLYTSARKLFWLIVVFFTLFGVILGALLGGGGDDSIATAITAGIVAFIMSFWIAEHYTLFIEAKAEILLRTARIQEDIDYLCKVKEMELNATAAQNKLP